MKFSNFMNSRDDSFWSFFQTEKRREATTATDDVLATATTATTATTTTTATAERSHGNICVICRHVFPTATCCSNSNSTSSYTDSNSSSCSSRQQQQSRSKRRSISRNRDCDCDCNCESAVTPTATTTTTTTFPRTQEHVAKHVTPTCCECSSSSSNSCCCNCSSSSSSCSCRWCSSNSTNDNNQKLTTTTTANCNWSNNLQQQQQQTRRHRKHYQHYGRTHSAAFASASASAFTILALLAMQATTTFAWQTTQPPWPSASSSASALHTQQEDQLLQEQQQQQQQQWEQQQDYEDSQRFANSLASLTRRTRSASNNAISRGSDIDSGSDRGINIAGEARLANKVTPCKSIDIRNSILESKKLENCTVIEGFLLLTLISDASILNRTFPLLTEITGYLVVYRVQNLLSLSLMFPNLSVIRGNILFEGYALVIYQNHHLSDVGLYNLRAITKGGVRIEKNSFLCFYNTINWMKILPPNATNAELKLQHNRDEKQCAKCPGDSSQEVGGDGSNRNKVAACQQYNGKRYCWNSERCQKFCPKECPYSCINETTCCNKACLGGCTGADKKGLNQCVACRHASNSDDMCIDSCNKQEYLYEQRCLTAAACLQVGKKYENSEEMPLLTHNGKCTTRCDKGYVLNNGTCEKCIGRCIKKCIGDTVESVERSKKFQGCTHIVEKGLQITIKRGGPHVTQALIAAFGMLETIETYLQVYSTYGIVTLDFFKNLKRIKGDVKFDGRYSLYVLENRDLETIWGENQTVQIESGNVFFHFNQKLCYENIEVLQRMLPGKPKKFNKNEVSEDSNGDKGKCNTRWMQVGGLQRFSTFFWFDINNTIVEFNDDRSFIGFLIYHALDPYENVTRDYEQSCSDVWKVSDPVMPEAKNTTRVTTMGLTPFTKYAFYVRTLTISSEKRNYQSDIHRFQTLPTQPMPVAKSMANSSVSSQILMRWSPSSAVNGILEKYQIRAVLSSRDPLLESNRNYCIYPLPRPSSKDEAEQKIAKEIEKAGCQCEGGQNTFSQSEVDRKLADDIEFENSLQNFLYVAKRKKPVENTNSTIDSSGDNAVQRSRSKRYIEINDHEPMESALMRTVRSATESVPDVKTQNETDEHLDWVKERKMDPTNTYYTVFSAEVPANTTEYLFTNLRHFSLYTLSVHVCRKRMDYDSDQVKLCSSFESWEKRTFMRDGVDKVEAPVGRLERIQNSTRDSVRLTWDPPANPNGAAVSYSILYSRVDKEDNTDVERKCITAQEYLNQSGYVFTNLKEGRYRFTVQVGTLAGDGEFSEETFVTVPPPSKTWAEIAVWIVVPLIALLALSLIIYFYIKSTKKHPQDLVMNTEVNPFYASLQYVPDDWEVPRERIIQLGPLGQGSFGMVYEGILKAQNSQDEDTPCAIKTVNENATDRERTNFLSEASVMKQFDTYHVVHLLGVCSCGQPALVVMELMKKGDLKSYLRAHRPDEREALSAFQQRIGLTSNPQPPPYSRIYQMAIEIADGMAYLAYKKFVHRDLAARNCMVAEDLTVKIGDFGMTRDIYETDYYRKGTKGLLPVRWMPPESLRDGVYASSSDVFSFGVVLWEMATLASQPYQGLSNEQVLRFVIDGGIMERPDNCPEAMHALMHRCWHHRPSARPTFLEIIAYLEHLAEPKFKEVAFYYSDAGVQHREKERKENSNQMEIQLDPDPHMDGGEDATTPLRVGEYQGEYKSNMQHNTSMDQPAESPIALVDDQATTHSPFSMHSGFIVSSTPDALSTMPTAGGSHMEDAAYVMPDGHGHAAGTHPEQGYEIFDPSPNFIGRLSGEQHLLPKKKHGAGNVVGNMSSSMPDEMIDGSGAVAVPTHVGGSGGASSSLQPSTGSSSNASNSRHPSLKRVVAETLRNRVGYGLLSRFNHKRSGSNVSHKSNVSNAPSSSSNSNLTSHPVGMAMTSMGTNLGTIESGGSGSAGSYAGTPHFYTPTATTPSAAAGCGGGGNGSTTIVSDNPNYKLLDESINSAGDPVGNSSAWPQQLTTSSLNPNYELMQPPPPAERDAHTRLLSSDNPNYVLMNDPNPPSEPTGHIFTTDNPNYAAMMAPIAVRNSSDDDNNDDDDNDDDADEHTEHIKMERMPLSRQKPRARIKPMQHQQQQQPRSRSVSQTRKSAAAETPTPTPTAAVVVGGTGGNTSNLLKENWLRQASTPRPPPPNGFIGREA